jgi:hypothetical protein
MSNDPASSRPAAGWYPQADGTQRYWNGDTWTGHTATRAKRGLWDQPAWAVALIVIAAVGAVIVTIPAAYDTVDEALEPALLIGGGLVVALVLGIVWLVRRRRG